MAGGILMTMHRMSQGGADRVAILLANGFVAAGIETDFVLLRDGGEGEAVLTAMLDPRVRVHIAGTPMRSRHLELVRGRGFIRDQAAAIQPAALLASIPPPRWRPSGQAARAALAACSLPGPSLITWPPPRASAR